MPNVPLWLLGKHVTTLTATLQVINATTGALTDSTGTDIAALTGVIDEIQLNARKVRANINAATRTRAHHVRIAKGDTLTLREILRTGANKCLLANLWFSSTANTGRIVKVVFTRGGNTWTFYGRMKSYHEPIGREKNVGTLVIGPIDIGAANADYNLAA